MNSRTLARVINATVRHSDRAVYLRSAAAGDGIRLFRARTRAGALHVQALGSGRWIQPAPGDAVEIMHGGRVAAAYTVPPPEARR